MALIDLNQHEGRIYSQNGEDGVIAAIFAAIGDGGRFFVEIGTGEIVKGKGENNTLALYHAGWKGLWFDLVGGAPVIGAAIKPSNVNELLDKHKAPKEPDLLSLDIDGLDYWVLIEILRRRRPRVLVCEYNASCGPDSVLVVKPEPDLRWRGTNYFGGSLAAMAKAARSARMTLVYCGAKGVNAFFVRDEDARHFVPRTLRQAFRLSPACVRRAGRPEKRVMRAPADWLS